MSNRCHTKTCPQNRRGQCYNPIDERCPTAQDSPNGSGSSARTRGSLAASPGQNEVETALNSPPFSGRAEASLSQTDGVDNCAVCRYYGADEDCNDCEGRSIE